MINTAKVFNIQRYSLHDGPGIRTIIFLKGCPLSCLWCSNPESQNAKVQVVYTSQKCISCGACEEKCEYGATILHEGKIQFDIDKCVSCGECIDICPTNSMEYIGKDMTIDEVIIEIEKDNEFYLNSEGGVTFSGGEPTLHYKFLEKIVPKLKARGLHVAIETTGYCEWDKLWKSVKDMDLVLFDLKQMNNEKHIKYTGVDNNVILKNAEKLSTLKKTIFRIPVIPGYNDEIENFEKIAFMLSNFKNKSDVNVLPYHSYGKTKYNKLGKTYELVEVQPPTKEFMEKIIKIFQYKNINATII